MAERPANLDEVTLRELADVLRRRDPLAVSFGSDHSHDGNGLLVYLRNYEYGWHPLPAVPRGQVPTITLPSGRLVRGSPSDIGKAFTAAKALK
jgi:hypothetical protein